MCLIWCLWRINSESQITRIKGFHGLKISIAGFTIALGFLSRSLFSRLIPAYRGVFLKAGAPEVRSRFGDRSYSNKELGFARFL